jgi:hypothetical protein
MVWMGLNLPDGILQIHKPPGRREPSTSIYDIMTLYSERFGCNDINDMIITSMTSIYGYLPIMVKDW